MNAVLRYTIYVLFVGSSIQFPLCSLQGLFTKKSLQKSAIGLVVCGSWPWPSIKIFNREDPRRSEEKREDFSIMKNMFSV